VVGVGVGHGEEDPEGGGGVDGAMRVMTQKCEPLPHLAWLGPGMMWAEGTIGMRGRKTCWLWTRI
jgi:hypothetical protein